MTLKNCSTDILSVIISFLNNKSSITLSQTCKKIHNHSQNYGYLSSMKANKDTDLYDFMFKYYINKNTLNSIEMHRINNPQNLITTLPEVVTFNHCVISEFFNPTKKSLRTKKLVIK